MSTSIVEREENSWSEEQTKDQHQPDSNCRPTATEDIDDVDRRSLDCHCTTNHLRRQEQQQSSSLLFLVSSVGSSHMECTEASIHSSSDGKEHMSHRSVDTQPNTSDLFWLRSTDTERANEQNRWTTDTSHWHTQDFHPDTPFHPP